MQRQKSIIARCLRFAFAGKLATYEYSLPFTPVMYEQFLEVGKVAVDAAKIVTMSYFGKSVEELGTMTKLTDARFSDDHQKSPVTRADKEAEHTIKTIIKQHFPMHGFVGEEEGSENETAAYQRSIDPIDGTRNFARGLPYRAILVSLAYEGEVIVAIVCTPVLGDLVRATKGGGTYHNGTRVMVSSRALSEAYIGHGRHTHFQKQGYMDGLDTVLAAAAYSKSIISREMLSVATGALDATISLGTGNYYDNAPFVLLIQEAGGTVTTVSGGVFGKEDTSMIASNGVFHDRLVLAF